MTSLHNSVAYQFNKIDSTSNNFISRINQIKNRQDEVPATFGEELCKWSLESLCAGNITHTIEICNTTSSRVNIFASNAGPESRIHG